MPEIIFIIGANAAGKSTYIQKNFLNRNYEILDVRDYQQKLYKDPDTRRLSLYDRTWIAQNQVIDDAIKLLLENKNVVMEHTLFKRKRRITYIDRIKKAAPDTRIEIYVINPSLERWQENAKKRDSSAQTWQLEEIEFPDSAEDFDAIYEVIDDEIKLHTDKPHPELVEIARKELEDEKHKNIS